jgi:BirA family biotin operon repressor/biotin-[acetyl-CoA-carboxylase] ligase
LELIHLASVDSTNRYLRGLAENGAAHGTLVLADRQTAGRGRLDRRFDSPEGGLYMSLLLRPTADACDLGLLTALAAVSAARAIEASVPSLAVGIKWVNDLYVGGKKLAGILSEAALSPCGGAAFVIVGIGINLKGDVLSPELGAIATSVEEAGGEVPEREALAASIAEGILSACEVPSDCLPEYRRRQILLGRRVRVYAGGRPYTARAIAVDDRGGLVVSRFLRKTTLRYGEVSVRVKS